MLVARQNLTLTHTPTQVVIVSNQGPLKYASSERLDLFGRDVPAVLAVEKQQNWHVDLIVCVVACEPAAGWTS